MKFQIEATYTVKVKAKVDADSAEAAGDNDFETLLFLANRYGKVDTELEVLEAVPVEEE